MKGYLLKEGHNHWSVLRKQRVDMSVMSKLRLGEEELTSE